MGRTWIVKDGWTRWKNEAKTNGRVWKENGKSEDYQWLTPRFQNVLCQEISRWNAWRWTIEEISTGRIGERKIKRTRKKEKAYGLIGNL